MVLSGCSGLHRSHFGAIDEDKISVEMTAVAGKYERGGQGFWHDTLIVANDGCFERSYTDCTRSWNLAGRARLEEGELVLDPDWDLDTWFDASSAPAMYRVLRWDARTYLVQEDELQSFRFAVNHGSEPRNSWDGTVLLRSGDWLMRPTGSPEFELEL